MENVATVAKGDAEAIVICWAGIGLVFDRGFIERVTADGTCVCTDVPRPHRYGVPFLDLETRGGAVASWFFFYPISWSSRSKTIGWDVNEKDKV